MDMDKDCPRQLWGGVSKSEKKDRRNEDAPQHEADLSEPRDPTQGLRDYTVSDTGLTRFQCPLLALPQLV